MEFERRRGQKRIKCIVLYASTNSIVLNKRLYALEKTEFIKIFYVSF